MKLLQSISDFMERKSDDGIVALIGTQMRIGRAWRYLRGRFLLCNSVGRERGDVPGWVLVVLMTTGLVTAIWTIAAPRLTAILRNSLDSMNGIR